MTSEFTLLDLVSCCLVFSNQCHDKALIWVGLHDGGCTIEFKFSRCVEELGAGDFPVTAKLGSEKFLHEK